MTPRGRRILVERVLSGSPISHVAKSMGVSRHCASRWVARYRAEGEAGLEDRSSRPHHCPRRTPADLEARIVALRRERRVGPGLLSGELGVPARTISRVLARAGEPRLTSLDPMTGELIRASRVTPRRYERPTPGDLVHVDVKKLGRIPEGGGWRALGRGVGDGYEKKRRRIGFDYVHSMVDDMSRLAYSEVLANERVESCAGFLTRATAWFAERGISVNEVITDNAFSYRRGRAWRETVQALGVRQLFIKPHCPWQNGKVERFNRTLQVEWAYRRAYTSNEERSTALAEWLKCYNYERPHSSLGGRPPISRVAPT